MNDNRDTIITLCSYLCLGEDIKPYTIKEWSQISSKLIEARRNPYELFNFTDDEFIRILGFNNDDITRIKRLFARSASLRFEIESLSTKGIYIVTRADNEYPKLLKNRLGQKCPPLFYYSGDLNILNNKFIGFVGSRSVENDDIIFTQKCVDFFVSKGYAIVSGGAKGVDRVSTTRALESGAKAIEFISDSLSKRIKEDDTISAIRKGSLLLLSSNIPSAGFDVGNAMQRNKYIYSLSEQTIVIKSDYGVGGTWAGAKEALSKGYGSVCCWDHEYQGNQELIKLGASFINDDLVITL